MDGGKKKNHFITVKMAMEKLQKEQVEGKEELRQPFAAGFWRLWREGEDSVFQENQEGNWSQSGTWSAPH